MKIQVPAKINLSFDCLGKRDDGYTEIQSLMQTINFFDTIHIRELSRDEIIIKSNLDYIPRDRKNTVYVAAELIKKKFQIRTGLEFFLDKRIPVGGGLGGGSSNAAGVLAYLNKLWKLNLSDQELIGLASQIGSDVPFFIKQGLAWVRGRGEKITYLGEALDLNLLIVLPNFSISTREVYANLDFSRVSQHVYQSQELLKYFKNVLKSKKKLDQKKLSKIISYFHNDLEESAMHLYPDLGEIKAKLEKIKIKNNKLMQVMLSGSGSSLICFFEKKIYEKVNLGEWGLGNCKFIII